MCFLICKWDWYWRLKPELHLRRHLPINPQSVPSESYVRPAHGNLAFFLCQLCFLSIDILLIWFGFFFLLLIISILLWISSSIGWRRREWRRCSNDLQTNRFQLCPNTLVRIYGGVSKLQMKMPQYLKDEGKRNLISLISNQR